MIELLAGSISLAAPTNSDTGVWSCSDTVHICVGSNEHGNSESSSSDRANVFSCLGQGNGKRGQKPDAETMYAAMTNALQHFLVGP